MPLHPRQIEAFQAVMRCGSMTAAAEILHVTQPAVSRLVREFEASVGMELFQRAGSRIVPTSDARQLHAEIERHFVGIGRISRAAEEIRTSRKGSVRVAAIAALSIGVLNQAVHNFMESRPGVRVRLHTDNSLNIAHLVAMRHTDIGFVGPVPAAPGVRVMPLPEAPAVCLLPSRHSLTRLPFIRPEHLRGRPLVSLAEENPLRQRFDALLLSRGIETIPVVETSLAASVSALVALRLGVAVIDPFLVQYLPRPGVVVRPFVPQIPSRHSALLPAHQAQRHLVMEFYREVARCMQDLPRGWTIEPMKGRQLSD